MEFMLLFVDRKGAPGGEPTGLPALSKYADELKSQGKLRRAAPLGPESAGTRLRVRDGKAIVHDGPFAESQEALGGFWLIEAANRDEAIAIARRAFEIGEPRPEARHGSIEVHPLYRRWSFTDSGRGTLFLFAFRMEEGLCDHGAKMQEMLAFAENLASQGRCLETAPLTDEPAPARIEARAGKTLVIDGPFAETKEGVGGYSLVRAASRAEAIEIAKRYPHARWGLVEVRETA
jgi:hypothetical protein